MKLRPASFVLAALTAFSSLVPTLVLFLLAQKYFVQGITMSGIKG